LAGILELKYANKILLGKLEDSGTIWTRRPGLEDNIKTDLEGNRM
jgi:hypothetical protein